MTIAKAVVITKNGRLTPGIDQNHPESVLHESAQVAFSI